MVSLVFDAFGVDRTHAFAKSCPEELRNEAHLGVDPVRSERQQPLKNNPAGLLALGAMDINRGKLNAAGLVSWQVKRYATEDLVLGCVQGGGDESQRNTLNSLLHCSNETSQSHR